MSDSLGPHGLQYARFHCPSLSWSCSSSSPLRQWCHPTISSSVSPFSCPQSFPASGPFPMTQLFTSGGQSIRASVAALGAIWILGHTAGIERSSAMGTAHEDAGLNDADDGNGCPHKCRELDGGFPFRESLTNAAGNDQNHCSDDAANQNLSALFVVHTQSV